VKEVGRPPAMRLGADERVRLWALGGAALIALSSPAAMAQTAGGPAPDRPAAEAVDDGLGEKGFYLEADEIEVSDKTKVVTARKAVEVRYRGRVLRAAELTYNTSNELITAKGDVTIINPDGTAQFADEVVLDGDLKAGVALGFSTRLQNNVKLAAHSAIRRSEDLNELNLAIYTPCDVCAKGGAAKEPTWSIQAEKVVQDRQKRTIFYRNAVIRVKGIPVLYAPVFWHADPTAGKQSGLLAPRVSISEKRGGTLELPYYWVLSPSADLTLSPMFSTKVNPLIQGEFRKRFASGDLNARFGYTYEREFDNNGQPIPGSDTTSRSYVLASGAFKLAPNWTWGFSAERVSDPLFFDRYDVPDVYERRGLYETDTRRLLSQLYAVRQDQESYVSVAALAFQGLQIGDIQGSLPVVAPLIEGRWAPKAPILGGQLKIDGSAVVLTRDQSPVNPVLPGTDSRRLSIEGDWRRSFILPVGIKAEPFIQGRFDLYNVEDLPGSSQSESLARGLGTAGVNVSWPFIRQAGGATFILEPIVQAAISPDPDPDPRIPNEDSQVLMFDETNLFDPNRVPGFDIYDGGARLNVGGRASAFWGAGRDAWVFAGRSFRDERNPMIPGQTGYGRASSDWVVAAAANPLQGVELYGRTLLDYDNLDVRRIELGASFSTKWVAGYARYLDDRTDPLGDRHNLEFATNLYVLENWGFVVGATRDLKTDEWTRSDLGIIYRDECVRVEVVYHHEADSIRLGGSSDSIQLRLILATLADPGYRNPSDQW
jgi:LPS-assembly protein